MLIFNIYDHIEFMNETNQNLYERFCYYGKISLAARNKCIGLLPEIYQRKIYLEKGFASIHEFAAKLAGLSHEQVNRTLSLEKRLINIPVLHQALVKGEIGLNKLRKIVTIATVENQKEVLENAKVLSVRAIETMVRDIKKSGSNDEHGHVTTQNTIFPNDPQDHEAKSEPSLAINEEIQKELLEMQKKGVDINAVLQKFLENYRQELEQEKEKIHLNQQDPAINPGRTSRYIPAVVKKVLTKEFGECCSVPGCYKLYQEIHHLLPYVMVKQHDPRLMVQLCHEHHQITHRINRKVAAHVT